MVIEGRDTSLAHKSLGWVWCLSLCQFTWRATHHSIAAVRETPVLERKEAWLLLFLRLLSMLVKNSSALCAGIVVLNRQCSFVLQNSLISILGSNRKLFHACTGNLQVCLPVQLQNNTMFTCSGHGLLLKWSFPPASWNAPSPAMSVRAVVLAGPEQKVLRADFWKTFTLGVDFWWKDQMKHFDKSLP